MLAFDRSRRTSSVFRKGRRGCRFSIVAFGVSASKSVVAAHCSV
jgi:hypothetical protein